MATRVILGLGTNLGDRASQLQRSVGECAGFLSNILCSPVYETPALLPAGAPREWDVAFFNMAISGVTEFSPHALLAECKAIEARLGRSPRGHWGPREIDIDILAFGDEVLEDATLTLPHRELLKRDFALQPLADVAPEWRYPVQGPAFGKTARVLADTLSHNLSRTDLVII